MSFLVTQVREAAGRNETNKMPVFSGTRRWSNVV